MIGYTEDGEEIFPELEALKEVDELLQQEAVSLREASDYLYAIHGIIISHVGLRKRLENGIYKD